MWLLHAIELRLQQFSPADVPEYAILSHRWEQEEVTFQDMENETFRQLKGFSKLQGCCERAAGGGYSWVWIDTCCIDKTSSAELSEAINSMYHWYHDSAVCYAYLADIQEVMNLATSKWFTRGWTLQELVAPRRLILFDGQWREIGTKHLLAEQISSITTIPKNTLLGSSPLYCNVAQRMSWASMRHTSREEDMAYCLMGLFDVHMLPIYGEGLEKAFLRLQEEILKRSSDQTLLLWTPSHEPYNQGLLATSPSAFCTHYDCFSWMRDLGTIPREVSPYSLFKPTSSAPSSQTFDNKILSYDSRNWAPDYAAPLVSLGPRGLQISLLLSDDKIAFGIEHTRHGRIISLDVFAALGGEYINVTLNLVRDIQFRLIPRSIPYRLGAMRRAVCIEPISKPRLNVPLSFKRSTLAISQVGITEPGCAVTFTTRNSRSGPLAGEVKIFHPEGTTDILSCLKKPFICSFACIDIKHSCPECGGQNGKYVLIFGTRGRRSEPWCTLAKVSPPVTVETLCRKTELLNPRFSDFASRFLACNRALVAEIKPGPVNANVYNIDVEIRDSGT
jgi:hypothetical protein